jgi:hypothetical protein
MKRLLSIRFLCLLLLVAGIALGACSKKKARSWLLGRWNRINVVNVSNSSFVEDWEFYNDGTLVIHYGAPGPGDTVNLYGNFSILSYNRFTIHIPDKSFDLLNGYWQITNKKNNNMMIVFDVNQVSGAGGGLTFREFQRR